MTKRSTKRALMSSVLALILCFAMLLGTTYAWFTDSVTSGTNIIQSGNLDVVLEYKTNLEDDWAPVDENTKVFKEGALYEPGYTEVVFLRVANAGSLALKYTLSVNVSNEKTATNVYGEEFKLSDYLQIGTYVQDEFSSGFNYANILMPTMFGTSEAALSNVTLQKLSEANTVVSKNTPILSGEQTSQVAAIVLTMPSTVGNEANTMPDTATPSIDLSVSLFATQLVSENDSFGNDYDSAAGTAFVGGYGTKESPYLINAASQMLTISDYDEYTYFKVANGVKTLDMTGVGKIELNGSFDGNGVVMNNLTTALFQSVGDINNAQEIKISNFTANVNNTDGNALVKNIYNPGNTIFENVTLHGYIEGQYNIGSFYNYGTANHGSSNGSDYTVSFVNAKSDVTLVCTTGNAIGGMLGHGFEGQGNVLSINMDDNSGYTGNMYTTGTATCYKVMAMCSGATYVLNGTEISRSKETYPSTKLTVATPTAGADGYYVAPVAGVDHYVVYINSQLSAYENGVKIANKAGMTWNLGKETVSTGLDGKLFDLITSAKIVNNTENELGYAMNNGELTIYSGRSDNYATGWVTLQVNQYDAQGNLLATGNLKVHTFKEVKNANELAAAIANGGNVVLVEDIDMTVVETAFVVAKGVTAKLDLNGHNITATSDTVANVQLFSVSGNLEIFGEGTISLTNSELVWSTSYRYTAINIRETGVVTLDEGVKVVCTAGENTADGYAMTYAVDIYTTGTLNINGASLHSNYIAVRCFFGDSVVNVNSGSITSSRYNYGIWKQSANNAKVTIADGIKYTTNEYGIYIFA